MSLEYGHGAGQHWYAAVYEGDERLSFSEVVYDDDGSYEQEVSFDAINEKLKEIGLFSEDATSGYYEDASGEDVVRLVDINEKTPGVTMLVSGSVEDGWGDSIGTVEYIDYVKYD